MLHNIITILKWIARYWYPDIPKETSSYCINHWISLIHKWIHANGVLSAIKRIKMIRLITTRYICGKPLMVNHERVSVTKDGFPSCLIPFKELVDGGSPQALRFVLTCLVVSRALPSIGKADISSITKESTAKYVKIDDDFIELFINDFIKEPFNPLTERPSPWISYLSMKAGPIIGPAILTAHVSASCFTGCNLWGLATIGGDKFMEWVKELKLSTKIDTIKYLSAFNKSYCKFSEHFREGAKDYMNRKFIQINDPESKVRIVGCYDYISQLCLTPYSEWAFNTLRKFPRDRTFTQDPVINNKITEDEFHSLDLSSATDRFPIQLQVQFLEHLAGPAFAAGWKNLMVNEPFEYLHWEDSPNGRVLHCDMIKYQVGQPMGARSSWATFTLCHHMVVQYAAFLEGEYPFDQYILLGDDIVIYNDKVAKRYTEIIRDLGVEISEQKSHVSIDTYEFAKRWFRKGIEISPVPIRGFVLNSNNPKLLYSQLLELIYKLRGPRSNISSLDIMKDLISNLRKDHKHDIFEKSFLIGLRYSRSQIKYAYRSFQELQLTLRNIREFDYERTRNFLADASKNNEYILPFDEVSLTKEWVRAASGVVNGMAMGVIKQLSSYYARFKVAYTTSIAHSSFEGCPKMESHPLTISVYRSVKAYHIMNKAMGYTLDLSKQLETITLLDLDKLAKKDRTSEELIFTYSTFGRKLARQVRDDPDLIIAKARSMQFGRSLMDIQFAMEREFPILKLECS